MHDHPTFSPPRSSAMPHGFAMIILSLKGLITRRECHPEDEQAFDGLGLQVGETVMLLPDGRQYSHRDNCESVRLFDSLGNPTAMLGLCFLSRSPLMAEVALGLARSAIDAASQAPAALPATACESETKLPRGGLAAHVLRRVERYLDEHLPDTVSVADMATISGLSVSHFSREFRRSVGVAPYQYVQQRRLRLAATVVVKSAQSLADIALEMGFSDQSHFSRSFTRTFGTTPRAFRRAHAEVIPIGR
jgi:AraC-like DNA-binding protein